jgi:L-rhamnose isomerase/sugar isomerase
MTPNTVQQRVFAALDNFAIEVPSWGFANTGTRFGKFVQPAAAVTLAHKFADAAEVHRLTGSSPTIALHVQWDLPRGKSDIPVIRDLEKKHGILAGSINPNLFQDQQYKFGSLCNPSKEIRQMALNHLLVSVEIGRELNQRDVSVWLADGSNYPGTQSIRRRIDWMQESFSLAHAALGPRQRMLIEYKPFEPAFYHTDIADWGMAGLLARGAGPRAMVLVDTGHHYASQNIEQIVAWLLHAKLLGGFHFNDRRYADDDLTLGSIDPYQVFRIFAEIMSYSSQGGASNIAYMIDQSHNLKGKMEAMIQTVATAQELYAKAALIDQAVLAKLQDSCDLVAAEELYRAAFWEDVRPAVHAWRRGKDLPENPLTALRDGGYVERAAAERGAANAGAVASYA